MVPVQFVIDDDADPVVSHLWAVHAVPRVGEHVDFGAESYLVSEVSHSIEGGNRLTMPLDGIMAAGQRRAEGLPEGGPMHDYPRVQQFILVMLRPIGAEDSPPRP